MANSRYEYVRDFELDDRLLPNCHLVVRIDGHAFHRFSNLHQFKKPNDLAALHLMNRAAEGVMKRFEECVLGYGISDEYSFVFRRGYSAFDRRESKLITTVVSIFTGEYIMHWSHFFPDTPLRYPPSFDGRAVSYPTDLNLRDYLSWRQVDCHINNLFNTTFWALQLLPPKTNPSKSTRNTNSTRTRGAVAGDSQEVDPKEEVKDAEGEEGKEKVAVSEKMSAIEAEERLRGTLSSDKNEILWSRYGINYNNEPEIFKKGSILLYDSSPPPPPAPAAAAGAAGTTMDDLDDTRDGHGTDPVVQNQHEIRGALGRELERTRISDDREPEVVSKSEHKRREKRRRKVGVSVVHVDMIGDGFWERYPDILR